MSSHRRVKATALAAVLVTGPLAAQPAPAARPAPVVPAPAAFGPTAAPATPAAAPPAAGAAATPVKPPPGELDARAGLDSPLDPYAYACDNAAFLAAHVDDLTACYGDTSKPVWATLAASAQAYVTSHCGAAATVKTEAETDAQADVDTAARLVEQKAEELEAATIAFNRWRDSQEVGHTEKTIAAEVQKVKASKELEAAKASLTSKQAALRKAKSSAALAKEVALNAVHQAITDAEKGAITDDEFEALVAFESLTKNEKRRKACMMLRQSERGKSQLDEAAKASTDEALSAEWRGLPAQQHAADTLRTSQATATSTTTTSALIENPGSPESIAFSVLSALGADAKTTGTQTVLNLNLSSLMWPDNKERLKQPAWQRNLFLRGAFPLNATDKVPQTGAGAASAGTADEVSRFSLLLGGSFIDETDTRLPDAQECYELVTVFIPFPQTVDEAAARSERRKQLYDVCAHIAAKKTRLAWRAGLGFYTPNNVDTPKTRPELGVGAIVWAPFSQLYLDFLYQGIIKPARIDNMGIGFSFAGNVDATKSGVNAALRLGLDYMFLLSYDHADASTDWEMRIAPTVRGKVFGNSIGTVSLGPRILGSKLDSPGVLATIALSYDADTLVNSLLTPPVASAK